jgi:hypothetical protein
MGTEETEKNNDVVSTQNGTSGTGNKNSTDGTGKVTGNKNETVNKNEIGNNEDPSTNDETMSLNMKIAGSVIFIGGLLAFAIYQSSSRPQVP